MSSISVDWNPEKSCILRGHSPGGKYGDPFTWVITARFHDHEDDVVFFTGLCVTAGHQFTRSDFDNIKRLIKDEFKMKRLKFDRDINGRLIRREYE